MRRKQTQHLSDGGQSLVLLVFALAALMGFTAMAVDVGLLFEDRRHLQNTSDAMALAGVSELPLNPIGAKAAARHWAKTNGVSDSQIVTMDVRSTYVLNDTLYVQLGTDFEWFFARALGLTSDVVTADAAAVVGSISGAQGHTMPWALLLGDSPCLDNDGHALLNVSCSVKVGHDSLIMGWRGALDFDGIGGGSAEYKDNIVDGTTDTTYCIDGTYAPEPPECQSSQVDGLDGNKVGPTDSAIDVRLAVGPSCDDNANGMDDFDEVFHTSNLPNLPTYTVNCPDSPWLVMIPIVQPDQIPVKTVTIRGWSLGYFKGYTCVDGLVSVPQTPTVLAVVKAPKKPTPTPSPSPAPTPTPLPTLPPLPTVVPSPTSVPTPTPAPGSGSCGGGRGHWEVQIQIVDATFTAAKGFVTAYNPLSGIRVHRLVQ